MQDPCTPHAHGAAPEALPDLAACRAAIDRIDDMLIPLLAERQAIVGRVAEIKAAEGISAAAPSRAAAVLAGVRERAEAAGLDTGLAETIWRDMIDHFVAAEQRTLGRGGRDA